MERVGVEVDGGFGAQGDLSSQVFARASEEEVREMMEFTDTVAEIQNTLGIGTPVVLIQIEVVKV